MIRALGYVQFLLYPCPRVEVCVAVGTWTGARHGRSAKGMMPSACRGWPVDAEHRRACPRSVESRNRGNLARSSKDPGLVYHQTLDATSAERGCGARGRGLRAWLYVVSFLVLPRVYAHTLARTYKHIYHTRRHTRTHVFRPYLYLSALVRLRASLMFIPIRSRKPNR